MKVVKLLHHNVANVVKATRHKCDLKAVDTIGNY